MRTFCCCIPVRFGVLLLSLLTAAFGGVAAAAAFYQLHNVPAAPTVERIVLIVAGAVYGVLFLFSLFGFIGACIASRPLVRSYGTILWVQWILTVVAGALFIWQLFQSNAESTFLTDCQNIENTTLATCQKSLEIFRIVYIVVYALLEIVILYTCIIVGRYVDQLRDEAMFDGVKNIERAAMQPPPGQYQYPMQIGHPYTPVPNKGY